MKQQSPVARIWELGEKEHPKLILAVVLVVLGVMGGMEVLETVVAEKIPHKHPLTAMIWTNEEGSEFPPCMMCSGIVCHDYMPERFRDNFEYSKMMKSVSIVDTTTTWKTLNLEFEIPSVSQYNYLLITYGVYKEGILRHMKTELLTKAEIENSIKNNAIFTLNSASGSSWSSADLNFKSDTILCISGAAASNNSRTKFAITSIQGIK